MTNSSLFRGVSTALARQHASAMRPTSKHRPLGSMDTGPEAAVTFGLKRSVSRAHYSSIRKIDRYARIWNKKAILQHEVPGPREIKAAARLKARTS